MNMAQVHPNVAFQQPSQIQQENQSAFVIVNETPSQRHIFPLSFKEKQVLAVSILKIIIGVFQLSVGIANFFFMPVFTTVLAFPIWCGVLFIVNGIIGVVIKCRKSKCTIAAFFGLSIVSLFFTSVMLICYSLALNIIDYNGNRGSWMYTCDYYPRYYCRYTWYRRYSSWFEETSLGLHGFLMALIVMELGCSIAAVVYSCKAYSKCCNTCDVNDCCTCVGCCECSTESLLHQELIQSAPQYQMHQFQQQQQHQQQQLFIQPSQTNQIFQQQQPGNAQQCSNPCSGLIKIILNWGGASKPLASIQHNPEDPHCIQVNLNSEGHPSDNAAILNESSEAMAGPLVRFNQFIANGIIGVVIKCWNKSRCTIGTFLTLSCASLVFTLVMVLCNSLAIYDINSKGYRDENCGLYGWYSHRCTSVRDKMYPNSLVETSLGLHGFLMVLIILELLCSMTAVKYSCKSYSKCCNTCECDDGCMCVGCDECSMIPLDYQELQQYQMPQFQQQHQQQQQQHQQQQQQQQQLPQYQMPQFQQQQHQQQQQQQQQQLPQYQRPQFQQQHHQQQQQQQQQQFPQYQMPQFQQQHQQQQQQHHQQQQQQFFQPPPLPPQTNQIFHQQQQQPLSGNA